MIAKSKKILLSKYTISMNNSRTQRGDSSKIIRLKLVPLDTVCPNDWGGGSLELSCCAAIK